MARTNYKATAAQARFIAHLASVKLDGTVEGLIDYYEDSEAGRLDYGYAYRSGSTLIQVARGMNKKAASALIDELKALPDYQSEPEPADDPEPETPAAEAEGQIAEDDEPADGKVVAYYEIDENRGQVFEAFFPFDLVADNAIDENGDVSADWLAGCFRARHMDDDLRDVVGIYPAGDILVPIPGDAAGLSESIGYTEAKDWAMCDLDKRGDLARLAAFPGYRLYRGLWPRVFWNTPDGRTAVAWITLAENIRINIDGETVAEDVAVPYILSKWPSRELAAERDEWDPLAEEIELDEFVEEFLDI